jgi:hypothetical protein
MDDGAQQVIEKPHVRIGTPAEVDAVMKLALMGCAENEFVPHNPTKVLQDVWAALNLEQGICGVIGPVGADLEGAVLLRVGQVWYSSSMHIEERAIFVHPAFRGARGGRAARLAEFSMDLADKLGLPLSIGVLSNHRTAAKVRLYQRILGAPAGAYWLYMPGTRDKPAEPH